MVIKSVCDIKTCLCHSRVTPRSKCPAAFLLAALAGFALLPALAQDDRTKSSFLMLPPLLVSHTGVHTHADYLLFDTGALDLLAMQRDTVRYPKLSFRAHSSLPTQPCRAAAGFGRLQQS